jgi:hypothetical protein
MDTRTREGTTMATKTVEGGCVCGDVRYRLNDDEIVGGGMCYCANCRVAHGAPGSAWISVPANGVTFTSGEPAVYAYTREDGRAAQRGFCGKCGSQLTYYAAGEPRTDITTCTLDDPEAFPPKGSTWEEEKLSWVDA